MTKKEVYAVSETPGIKGMINEILSFEKNLFIIFFNNSTTFLFTSFASCFFGISWLLPLLCSTKWTFVGIDNYPKKQSRFLFRYSSVAIVCMVNPDADNISSPDTSDPVATHRNIPESCYQHTVERSRSVGIFSSI
jgi:hypothetical protein